jgi:hypothetical protein
MIRRRSFPLNPAHTHTQRNGGTWHGQHHDGHSVTRCAVLSASWRFASSLSPSHRAENRLPLFCRQKVLDLFPPASRWSQHESARLHDAVSKSVRRRPSHPSLSNRLPTGVGLARLQYRIPREDLVKYPEGVLKRYLAVDSCWIETSSEPFVQMGGLTGSRIPPAQDSGLDSEAASSAQVDDLWRHWKSVQSTVLRLPGTMPPWASLRGIVPENEMANSPPIRFHLRPGRRQDEGV